MHILFEHIQNPNPCSISFFFLFLHFRIFSNAGFCVLALQTRKLYQRHHSNRFNEFQQLLGKHFLIVFSHKLKWNDASIARNWVKIVKKNKIVRTRPTKKIDGEKCVRLDDVSTMAVLCLLFRIRADGDCIAKGETMTSVTRLWKPKKSIGIASRLLACRRTKPMNSGT